MKRVARAGAIAMVAGLLASGAGAADLFVDARGSDMDDGLSWTAAKASVTAALAVAAATPEADVVRVAEGIYRERITVPPDTLLEGGWARGGLARDPRAHPAILDGQFQGGVVMLGPGTDASSFEGFVVRNGFSADPRVMAGITLDRTAASVRDCIVERCRGAALARTDGDGIVERCVFRWNVSTIGIVGAYDGRSTPGAPFLRDCAVVENLLLATDPETGQSTNPSVVSVWFLSDSTSGPSVERCLIARNSLGGGPAPTWRWDEPNYPRCPALRLGARRCAHEVRDTVIVGNDDAGLAFSTEAAGRGSRVVNCLIADNRRLGVVLACGRDPPFVFENTTLAGHAVAVAAQTSQITSPPLPSRWHRSVVMGGIDWSSRINPCGGWDIDGTDSIVEGGLGPAGTNILDVDPLFVPGPAHDHYLSQLACGDAADSPALDAGPALAADVGMAAPYSTCRQGTGDAGLVDWGFHASGLGYALYPDGAVGLPLRILRGSRPDSLVEIATTGDLPWLDAPGLLDDPALPLLFYSVETVLNDVRAVPDDVANTVRLTW